MGELRSVQRHRPATAPASPPASALRGRRYDSPPAAPVEQPAPPDWEARIDRARRFGHNFADVAVSRRSSPLGETGALPAAPVIQRQVDLRKHFGSDLSNETLTRLEEIQALLGNPKKVKEAMGALEHSTSGYKESGQTANQALNSALQDTEWDWMEPERVKVTSDRIDTQLPKLIDEKGIPLKKAANYISTEVDDSKGPMPPEAFVDQALGGLGALKDVGAGPQHGEYAHRLQWYAIHHHLNQKFNKERSEGDGKSELRHLYTLMSNPDRVIDHPLGLKEKDGSPVRISLWDAVLDARGEWTAGKHGGKENEDVGEMYGDVNFGAPALLTAALTNRDVVGSGKAKVLANYDKTLKKESWAKDFPTVSEAVTRRKLKRMELPYKEKEVEF